MTITCITNAEWVAAWDQDAGRQVYKRDIDVAFDDDRIVHVGPGYDGAADTQIDGRGLFVMPGLVDIHSHPTTEPAQRGVREEHGVPGMYQSSLYERSVAFHLDGEGRRAAAEVAYSELLTSGVTSLADLSGAFDGWLDILAKSGLRAFVAPGYASSTWHLENDYDLQFTWDEEAGRQGMDAALKLIDEAEAHPSGRLTGILYPAQIDTCTEELLRDSAAVARERGRPLTTHIAQSVPEFLEMTRRHGITPIQWANDIGLLNPGTILGHAIFIDQHSWLHWQTRKDLDLLADTGIAVAHCPTPFARYGQTLEDLGRYIRAGVTMGIGTDCAPHNLLEEMRWAAILARVAAGDLATVSTADVFHVATVGGATALMRDDIGRLAPGMKADIVLADLTIPEMMPARDPLRGMLYTAADRAVRDVYIDGNQVVADGKVLTLDREDAAGRLAEAQARMFSATPQHDYAGRSADEISPLSLPIE
jgi:5-methylthioadenosine/S-adenosylhomocysteine deaminase